MEMAKGLSLRGRLAPVAISGRQCRFVPAAVKMARADCVCSGAHCAAVGGFAALRMRRPLYGERAPCEEPFNRARALVHRGTPLTCHSEERSDVGISCSRLRFRRGLPAIQHGTARLPRRLRLLAMTHQAVQRCTRALLRLNFPRTGRSLSAATDAIGLYVLSFSVRTDSAFPRLPRRPLASSQ